MADGSPNDWREYTADEFLHDSPLDHEGAVMFGHNGDGDPDADKDDLDPEGKAVARHELVQIFGEFFEDLPAGKDLLRLAEDRLVSAGEVAVASIIASTDPQKAFDYAQTRMLIERTEERMQGSSSLEGRPTPVGADRYPRPKVTLDLGDREALVERLTTVNKDEASKLRMRSSNHSWFMSQNFEPYEHAGMSSLSLQMTTDPQANTSQVGMELTIHPDMVHGKSQATVFDVLMQMRAVHRGIDSFHFRAPTVDYNLRGKKGSGRLYAVRTSGGEAEEKLTVEYDGHRLRLLLTGETLQPKAADIEAIEDESERESAATKADQALKQLVEGQLTFITEQFPAYVEHIASLWRGAVLPSKVLEPQFGDALDLWGSLDGLDGAKDSDIPEEITDRRQRALYAAVAKTNPRTSFDMIGGLEQEVAMARRALNKAKHPERYEAVGLDPRATMLLVGPPGTGKTMIAEAVANEIGGIFLAAKGSDLMSMWAGEAEKNVAALFDMTEILSRNHKVVLFLDEIEAVAPSRSGDRMQEYERKITAEFLSALNRRYPNTIIIGATNAPNNVDQAVTRPGRFTDIISVGNPAVEGLAQIFQNWSGYYDKRADGEGGIFDDLDHQALAEATVGLNGADVRTIIEASLVAEVEASIAEERPIGKIGTTALLGLVELHRASTATRFDNYLSTPGSSHTAQRVVVVPVSADMITGQTG